MISPSRQWLALRRARLGIQALLVSIVRGACDVPFSFIGDSGRAVARLHVSHLFVLWFHFL